ncbi:unnamed protein product [Acanthoscelides obtectus]|uniref:Uncharacterized protein n=1 Tax=Acanthoscelides obtectus TaxID=200917 RepID=A0A9P0MJ81_ACAOB|nr:unnamed protein product [Acanthoscelides obtectus]CAK1655892.1 hypothetical protein AOBTE_LOCUS19416 [Acanthoscelides obtectus]
MFLLLSLIRMWSFKVKLHEKKDSRLTPTFDNQKSVLFGSTNCQVSKIVRKRWIQLYTCALGQI